MTDTLAEELFDILALRRRETLERGWRGVPDWVFCTLAGSHLDTRHVERVWSRVRRRAQKLGVRPLKLHCARHTWATQALQAGKSIRWVADVLGHSDPALTLRIYAHAMRGQEEDLSFAEYGAGRLSASPAVEERNRELAKDAESLARREGLEPPTLRFEA